jgi:queuine/archaeosine tRNA-ribosyltransferase
MSIVFEAKPTEQLNLRYGEFRSNGRILKTPHFFPVINVITGPPTPPSPVLANGGIWKWLKRLTLPGDVHVEGATSQPGVQGFLTQVLHFLDFNVNAATLDRWLPKGESDCIPRLIDREVEAANVKRGRTGIRAPFIFLDSGGYQLLGSQRVDLSAFGWKTRPKDILDLQLRFGGDFLATLDYPVAPSMPRAVVKERLAKSQKNALATLAMLHKQSIDDKLVFLAVHGRDAEEAYDYTRGLLKKVAASPARKVPHGLALGSLVPLNQSPAHLLETVGGAMRAVREAEDVDGHRLPVHAFGVNSTVAPYLALLGVDTFDGASYVRAAQSLKCYAPPGFTPKKIGEMRHLDCRCAGCTIIRRGALKENGLNLSGFDALEYATSLDRDSHVRYYAWKDGIVDDELAPVKTHAQRDDPTKRMVGVPKSYFYALLALHNLNSSHQKIAQLRQEGDAVQAVRALATEAAMNRKTAPIMYALARAYPKLSADLRRWGLETVHDSRQSTLEAFTPTRSPRLHDRAEKGVRRALARTDPSLGPEAFDVLTTTYQVPMGHVLLILPCSKVKPYSASPSHRMLQRALLNSRIDLKKVEKVTLSGNYGPVPHGYEDVENVLGYDYLLHSTNVERIRLLTRRMRAFLEENRTRYAGVVGYATQKPYRRVLADAFESLPGCVLLPDPLTAHTAAQFRSPKNLSQLAEALRETMERRLVLEAPGR